MDFPLQTPASGVMKVRFVWVEGLPLMKVGWRSVWTTTGELSVTMAGTWLTLRLSADNWATGLKVRSQMEQGLVMLE